jgi:hypothetical protein
MFIVMKKMLRVRQRSEVCAFCCEIDVAGAIAF